MGASRRAAQRLPASRARNRLSKFEMATLAMRTARPLDAGDALHERRHRRDHGRVRRRRIKGRAGRSEVYRLVRRAQ